MTDNTLAINTQEMDALTTSFYAEGFESQVNSFNPYCAKSQILPYHAWNAGFVDRHCRAPRKFIVAKQEIEMSREIEFRAWHEDAKEYCEGSVSNMFKLVEDGQPVLLEQFTGLLDCNGGGLLKVFEGDIIDIDGKIIGSVHEIQPRDTDLVIPRMGTKAWGLAYKKAVERGFDFAE